ncbi:hypothetical protein Q4511_03365 [Paracoccus sp. 1_MG-2023]|uniref:hypothetical protein n=1 Tax=unclassified Paracoccus (in: a-proteobacteria) TaxID=2688777 RepID=UPI001C08FEFE|nr:MULTISPECIES: hypothetical protein [unclassified Paracoccus (in: a-proteobacteria)]MBU2956275.1 hypothetical protein [Paracoccus sp. C2R09]MDO6667951.1 hypothetical protein [Paracoccus sp. 1_MG-2023]
MNRTRIVRWLRVLLPLAALAMLSTMFLFSRSSDTESRIPYAEVDAEAAAREGRLVAPEYSAVTSDGATIALRAAQGRPTEGGGTAEQLELELRRTDGVTATVTAPTGGAQGDSISLGGGVAMETSTGWRLVTDNLRALTGEGILRADDPIEADAPFGRITAGAMQLEPQDAGRTDGPAILNFSDGVRLIYRPETE